MVADRVSAKAGPYFDLYRPELGELIRQRVAEPQELLMGRCTHQMLGEYAGSPEGTDPVARRMDELPKTVLSHEASMPLPWTRRASWAASCANGKTYFFRARTNRDGKTTGWSPPRKVVT